MQHDLEMNIYRVFINKILLDIKKSVISVIVTIIYWKSM